MGAVHQNGDVWTLRRRSDGHHVADLTVTDADFPWLNAHVAPTAGFDDLRPLFAEELSRLDHLDEDAESWERSYDAVRSAVRLHYPDGREVPEFLLHVNGAEAWWRWNDEPFDEDE